MTQPASSPPILIVDDDEGLLILMAETLRAEGHQVATARSGREAIAWLGAHTASLMLLDLKLQDAEGPELLEKLQRVDSSVPFIVVTGQGDEKIAVEVMKHGALDYVTKNTSLLDLLPRVVQSTLATIAQDKALADARAERQRLERELIATSERERQSIGADLHDGVGQQLTAIELMCAALKEQTARKDPEVAMRLGQIGLLLRKAVAQTRLLSRGLVPVSRSPDGLQAGLEELIARTNDLGAIRCRFECPEPVLVGEPATAGHLYRIAQEAINNVIKHARARQVTVRLATSDASLLLRISDDGVGLPKRQARQGLGLGVMQHRASVIGAELTIYSKRGEGVTIACTVPLKP